jgi:rfaE bifunctional protein nucleotidyltransferase chain/domain
MRELSRSASSLINVYGTRVSEAGRAHNRLGIGMTALLALLALAFAGFSLRQLSRLQHRRLELERLTDQLAAARQAAEAAAESLAGTTGEARAVFLERIAEEIMALGDALIVALNGDESVRALKGPDRPVHSEADRAEVLLGLSSVDAVVIFNTPRTTNLISAIRPHLFAKGGDYTIATLNPEERSALEAAGSAIHILPELTGRSTSASLAKLNSPTSPRRTRFAILGSGAGSLFDTVADAASSGSLNLDIVLVASDNPTAGILAKASARFEADLQKVSAPPEAKDWIRKYKEVFGPLPPPGKGCELVKMDLELKDEFKNAPLRGKCWPMPQKDCAKSEQ